MSLGGLVAVGIRWRFSLLQKAQTGLLEAMVARRTAELAEKVEELQRSEQRAVEASQAKSVFLSNMSHELRHSAQLDHRLLLHSRQAARGNGRA